VVVYVPNISLSLRPIYGMPIILFPCFDYNAHQPPNLNSHQTKVVRLGIDENSASLGYGKTWQLGKNQFKTLQIETTLRIQKKMCRKNINDISILKIYKTIGFPSIHLIKYDNKKSGT
jgi:hypothetical protein